MFFARTLLSAFANVTGCGHHFALALLLLLCQLTYFAAIVDATLDLPAAELLQHAQQNAENYVKTGGDSGSDADVHHSAAYKQLMSHAFDAYDLPPSVEDELVYDDSAVQTDSVQDISPKAKQAIMAAFPPAAASALFMQLHNEQKQPKQLHHMHKSGAAKVHQQQQQQQQQQHHFSTLQQQHRRPCSIEISTKIPGFCQPMKSIGNACVSGEYMDVFNLECI